MTTPVVVGNNNKYYYYHNKFYQLNYQRSKLITMLRMCIIALHVLLATIIIGYEYIILIPYY